MAILALDNGSWAFVGASGTSYEAREPLSGQRFLSETARAELFRLERGETGVQRVRDLRTKAGDAYVVSGDLIIHPGGRVTGDAVSVLGHVRTLDGARFTVTRFNGHHPPGFFPCPHAARGPHLGVSL